MTPAQSTASRRPRVADDREGEIHAATIQVLVEVGYDRLTMDQVATQARASKATLYRHWTSKAELVVDAISRAKGMPSDLAADTGSLHEDLKANWCGKTGWGAQIPMSVMAGLMTALTTDPALAEAFRERFLEPRVAKAREVFDRAKTRGEIAEQVDVDILMSVLPAMCAYREAVIGQPVDEAFLRRVIEDVVLPAAAVRPAG